MKARVAKPTTLLTSTLSISSLIAHTTAQTYTLLDDYTPSTFASQVSFFTGDDPTHGYVNYVSQSAATAAQIFSTTSAAIHIGVDSSSVPSASARGRDSVRVESLKTYNSGTLFILDATHMPVGCGTWPAFWLYGPNWPTSGEVDIIEGVNTQAQNGFAAHTNAGCSVTGGSQQFLGQLSTSNCDVNAPGQATNAGCGITSSQGAASYGAGFNANNGGVYATQWTDQAISIWFFPRGNIPSDIASGSPNPASWGVPQAKFGGSACAVDQHFKDQKIVINTALCGDWAGGVWGQDATCAAKASTCQEFVKDNPSAFANAFWEIGSLRVYQASGDAVASTSSVAASSSAVATTSEVVVSTSTLTSTTTTQVVLPSTLTTLATVTQQSTTTVLQPTTAVLQSTTTAVLPSTFATSIIQPATPIIATTPAATAVPTTEIATTPSAPQWTPEAAPSQSWSEASNPGQGWAGYGNHGGDSGADAGGGGGGGRWGGGRGGGGWR